MSSFDISLAYLVSLTLKEHPLLSLEYAELSSSLLEGDNHNNDNNNQRAQG